MRSDRQGQPGPGCVEARRRGGGTGTGAGERQNRLPDSARAVFGGTVPPFRPDTPCCQQWSSGCGPGWRRPPLPSLSLSFIEKRRNRGNGREKGPWERVGAHFPYLPGRARQGDRTGTGEGQPRRILPAQRPRRPSQARASENRQPLQTDRSIPPAGRPPLGRTMSDQRAGRPKVRPGRSSGVPLGPSILPGHKAATNRRRCPARLPLQIVIGPLSEWVTGQPDHQPNLLSDRRGGPVKNPEIIGYWVPSSPAPGGNRLDQLC